VPTDPRWVRLRIRISYEQVSRPCGSGFVQFLVTPSCVITTFATADPS